MSFIKFRFLIILLLLNFSAVKYSYVRWGAKPQRASVNESQE